MDPSSSPAVTELKVRARLRLNRLKKSAATGDTRLRDCLDEVAAAAGFAHWEHARRVLAGLAQPGDDFGTFWHSPRCDALLNEWHAHYGTARQALHSAPGRFLLPYKRQFVVVQTHFLRELGLDPDDALWTATQADLVGSYGTPAWSELAARRLRAPAASFAPPRQRRP
jgi:hypothetical protein